MISGGISFETSADGVSLGFAEAISFSRSSSLRWWSSCSLRMLVYCNGLTLFRYSSMSFWVLEKKSLSSMRLLERSLRVSKTVLRLWNFE